jgi:hypothetical protein
VALINLQTPLTGQSSQEEGTSSRPKWDSAQGQVLPGRPCHHPHPTPHACLAGQGWELQVCTSTTGCWATALHRAEGSVLRRPPWASTQRTSRSRRPPPQEALHGPKSPAAQLWKRGRVSGLGQVPRLAWGQSGRGDRQVYPTNSG